MTAMVPSRTSASSISSSSTTSTLTPRHSHDGSAMDLPTLVHTPELHHTSREDLTLPHAKGKALLKDVDISASPLTQSSKTVSDLEKAAQRSSHTLVSQYKGKGTQADPYIVDWLENDPENPLKWNIWRKGSIVAIAAISTLCVAYASSAYAGGMAPMVRYFDAPHIILILGITLFVLGFAVGPLLWAPLSEIFGRRPIILVSYFPFVMFCLACALAKNLETLLICRFLSGTFGACLLTNAGGTTADMFNAKSRGLAMTCFALAPFLGPTLGPIASGFLANSSLGWRANFWLMFIFGMLCFIAIVFASPETYAPVLLRARAKKLEKQALQDGQGEVFFVSVLDADKPIQSVKERFTTSIFRPFELLFRETIVACFSVYMAYLYGILYMTFSSFPIVFGQQRGWSPEIQGLAFVGMAVGTFCGNTYYFFENRRYVRRLEALQKTNPGQNLPPEARLPAAIVGAVLIPIGLFIFAFTTYNSVPWIISVLAGIPFGAGLLLVFLCSQNYMIDAYLAYAASALAANAVLRALLGAVFPLFTTQMYANLGTVWASALPAFLALAGAPIPWFFMRYGPRIRKNSRYAPGHADAPPNNEHLAEEQRDMDQAQALDRVETTREARHPVGQ